MINLEGVASFVNIQILLFEFQAGSARSLVNFTGMYVFMKTFLIETMMSYLMSNITYFISYIKNITDNPFFPIQLN